jgi:hypothetical protein
VLLESLTQLGQRLDADWVDVFVLQVGGRHRHASQPFVQEVDRVANVDCRGVCTR